MENPVCLVAGVGLEMGPGAEIVRLFAGGVYRGAMIARNRDRLTDFENRIEGTKAFPADMADLDDLVQTVTVIRNDFGPPAVVVHNAPRAVRVSFLGLDPEDLERNFRVNVIALLHLARETLLTMLEVGMGVIVLTGNTSSMRGKAHGGFFASTEAAQRILVESITREFGPQGIHVAYFIIYAAINTPRTRPHLFSDSPDEFFTEPPAIADEVYHVAHQAPSA